ncbi:type II toxin-antitoxin system VapC family toxin [Diaphorobacter sp.]|uniref:type II toxin-antitoxin system VapC family toxin n=1 Tax=Diaphorobacter sp. TaxID=1934310 RepID=UPI003D108F5E
MYLLDTNTLIYFFKQQGRVAQHLRQTPASAIAISTAVLFELEYGLLRSTRPQALRQGMELVRMAYRTLDFDYACAKASAQIKHGLAAQGQKIGPIDTLIAGTALAHGLTLVTHNTAEFARVPGLPLADWYSNEAPA